MDDSRLPLRVAFWAISAALVLVLLATLSDPYQVRQSLLARRGSDRSPPATTAKPDIGGSISPTDRPLIPSESPDSLDELPVRSVEVPSIRVPAVASAQPDKHPVFSAGASNAVRAHNVSAGELERRRSATRPVERPAMPILAPGEVTGASAGGRFEELPPPPGMGPQQEAIEGPIESEGEFRISSTEAQALQQLKLETELLSLRHDLTLSLESRQSEQVRYLQEQQMLLLERQRQTADRLDQLAEQIANQSARPERPLHSRQQLQERNQPATITRETRFDGEASVGNAGAVVRVGPRLEETADGRRRLTLVIESDDFAGIVERLNRWSAAAGQSSSTPAVRSSTAEPPARFLAPPPAHADPTPLTDREASPAAPSQKQNAHRSATGGPRFAVPPAFR
jgi:hypothetical protein